MGVEQAYGVSVCGHCPSDCGAERASVKGEALPSRGQQQTGQNHPERRHSDQQAPWPSDKGPFSKGSELGQWLKGR